MTIQNNPAVSRSKAAMMGIGKVTLSPRRFKAAIFDLDGVVTRTAQLHIEAWKQVFDDYLLTLAKRDQRPFHAFDPDQDYRRYVDGKPRYEGVQSFLQSRGIDLPWGTPEDPPEMETICSLGNRKNRLYLDQLRRVGPEVYGTTVALIQALKTRGVRTAVVSSSKNMLEVLEAADLSSLFDAKVDGVDAEQLHLSGKPAPDVFLLAAKMLDVDPREAAVVEDAVSGVEAGQAGGFGLVIGVDRGKQADLLRQHGADVVVSDLGEVVISDIQDKLAEISPEMPYAFLERLRELTQEIQGKPEGGENDWLLVYNGYHPEREGTREALCTLGNGYFTTRGASSESVTDDIHYPGTYLAGGYNRLQTEISGRIVENEDLVNLPNWLCLTFRVENGAWFDLKAVDILSYQEKLDIKHGVLYRDIRFRDAYGRETTLRERRLVHMREPHYAALEITLTPENWSGKLEVRTALDGRVVNANVKRYKDLSNKHLQPLEAYIQDEDILYLKMQTNQSELRVAEAAKTRLYLNHELILTERHNTVEADYVAQDCFLEVAERDTVVIEKLFALYTSRDQAVSECGIEARLAIQRAPGFDALLETHAEMWRILWRSCDMVIDLGKSGFTENPLMILRLHAFHLLQTLSLNTIGLDVGVPARGWHGEAYRGHVFWDELFVFPFFNLRRPEITRSLLLYRYRRLDEAREHAREAGYKGAMFPWQSGSNGQEETPELSYSTATNRWYLENTDYQRHISAAVAYNIWQYFQATNDFEFLEFYGAEMFLEIARFCASLATYNRALDRYEIHNVMGPDEYHDRYPADATEIGLSNNTYTNVMVVWVLCYALKVFRLISRNRCHELCELLNISHAELEYWEEISRKMRVVFHPDGIISQFEGYEQLEELDWGYYRRKYGDIQRLDQILESEGNTPNRYKASKQADILMLFYLFSSEELKELFHRLGYPFEYETIPKNIDYYLRRTSNGSSLSRIVHSWVLARTTRAKFLEVFMQALVSDVGDIQGGTTREGIHLGAMAGTIDIIQRCYTGIVTRDNVLWLNPRLPEPLKRLHLRIRYRGQSVDLDFRHDVVRVSIGESKLEPIQVGFKDTIHTMRSGDVREFAM